MLYLYYQGAHKAWPFAFHLQMTQLIFLYGQLYYSLPGAQEFEEVKHNGNTPFVLSYAIITTSELWILQIYSLKAS